MENSIKLIKFILIINIIILIVAFAILGLQIYQITSMPIAVQDQKEAKGENQIESQQLKQPITPNKAQLPNAGQLPADATQLEAPTKIQPPAGKISTDKCGDGVCDSIERQSGACSQDCKSN